ncbi:MAG: glycosyltransferase family 2 protein [Candidatus Brocadia sp.]
MEIRHKSRIKVSVVIPAHNAAKMIAETLESLLAQSFTNWEAIIIDDGSNDGTAAVAGSFAKKDHRIRIVSQQKMGVSAARNMGISMASFDWLLFLDADDLILPQYLERMTRLLISDPSLDAVYCNWARVARDGTLVKEEFCRLTGDMFSTFARRALFPIHACIVRRSLVMAVGGFDTSLRTCEDWDLWQRVARTGAQFGVIDEALVLYRMQPASASVDGFQMLTDGLRVLRQGHMPDMRVQNPHPEHVNGLPCEELIKQLFYFPCWCAGLMIGCGKDARPSLNLLKDDHYPQLDPNGVAKNIFQAVPLPTCQTPAAWGELWPAVEQHIEEFLIALEQQAQAPMLYRRTLTALERLILDHPMVSLPLTIGTLHAVRIEVTKPIPDIRPPPVVDRLNCTIELEDTCIGTLELPICNGMVSGHVLADAIATEFFWKIIGRFFEHTVYRDLKVRKAQSGLSIWRGDLCIADNLLENESTFWQQIHDRIGWTVFLQEIWGCQDKPQVYFYSTQWTEVGWKKLLQNILSCWIRLQALFFQLKRFVQHRTNKGFFTVEVSKRLSNIVVSGGEVNILLTVGGAALGVVTLPVKGNIVRAQELRAAITDATGTELCRTAVREGLLGRPMTGQPSTLRARLAEATAGAAQGDRKGFVVEKHISIPGIKRCPNTSG